MLIVCEFHYIRCNMEYGLSYIISAKKLLKPQKKEANNGAEYNLVYLPLFGFTETTCVLNPFRFLHSLPPFTRASFFFFYNILIHDNRKLSCHNLPKMNHPCYTWQLFRHFITKKIIIIICKLIVKYMKIANTCSNEI